MKLEEQTKKSNIIFKGRVIQVNHDEVILPNGEIGWREVVHHRGGVAVLAIHEDNILLVKQYRYPYHEVLYECPAGKLEENETPEVTGMRELQEETGAIATKLHSLGKMYPSPGYTDEVIHLFYTTDFSMTNASLDPDEFLQVEKVPFKEAFHWIQTGKIVDAKTIIMFYRYLDIAKISV